MNNKKGYRLLHIEIDKYLCNHKCIFCYLSGEQSQASKYDYSQLSKVVDFCQKNNVVEVRVQGGEPTINRKIFKFYSDLAAQTKSLLNLVTNGTNFDAEWGALFAKSGSEVNFSLNSPNRQTYEKICGSDYYDKVIQNIKNFNKQRKDVPSPGCLLFISMVVCQQTIEEMADFYDLAADLGADKVHFFPDISSPNKLDISDPKVLEQYHKHFEKLLSKFQNNPSLYTDSLETLARTIQYQGELPEMPDSIKRLEGRLKLSKVNELDSEYYTGKEHNGCLTPWSDIFIDNSLHVYPCCFVSYSGTSWGNLKNNTLEDLLPGTSRKSFQYKALRNDYSGCPINCQRLKTLN